MSCSANPVLNDALDLTLFEHKNNHKSKKFKLDLDSSVNISPIKATQISFLNHEISNKKHSKLTAIIAMPYYENFFKGQSNSSMNPVHSWRVLLDSGSDGDLIFQNKQVNPSLAQETYRRCKPQVWRTTYGKFCTDKQASLDITIPEYSRSKRFHIEPDVVEYSDDQMPYFDLILGVNTMERLGIILNFKDKTITVDQITLPMRHWSSIQTPKSRHKIWLQTNYVEPAATAEATKRVVRILDAKYEKADLPSIVEKDCAHLTSAQQQKLLQLLQEFEELFDGTLGDWKTSPVHLELKEGIKPYHGKAYPVPHIHKDVLKKEVDRLEKIGVLKWEKDSQWASPTFIIPKSNGQVRVISDFREVNKRIERKPWPLPKITDILLELEGFRWATSLDLNMGYYTIRLDPDSAKVCTIIFPWGKYSYQRLPMGIAGSPDIFQEKMSELMATLEFVKTYLDDVLCISNSTFEDHLQKLRQVLIRLRDAGLKVNAPKSKFCATETEYLGYVLTRDGIKPQMKKVEAILRLTPPTNVKTLRKFLGLIQYYRDLWEGRSEVLAPLTDLVGECGETKTTRAKGTKKTPWHWDDIHQQAFENCKNIIAREVILAYPDFSEVFEIYTDASSRQLGAVITQNNRPIAFFSRKLSEAQQKYSVTELELLSIVETLKEFRGMLWGQRIKVYTDHQNLMRDALGMSSNRVYRWRVLIEEFAPDIVHIQGIANTVADAISRLDFDPTKMSHYNAHISDDIECHLFKAMSKCLANYIVDDSSLHTSEDKVLLVFATLGDEEEEIYPLTIKEIADAQRADRTLREFLKRGGGMESSSKHQYRVSILEDVRVITDGDNRMVIPKPLQDKAIQWYHHWLQHPGHTRLEETLRHTMIWPNMRGMVRRHIKCCRSCQLNKRRTKKYGKLPTKNVITRPWEALCVDLIGPYTLKGQDGSELDFMCLTMIDPASSWFEIVELPVIEVDKITGKIVETKEIFDKTSAQIANLVNRSWFSRYPRPRHVVYDNGSEFKLYFQALIKTYGLKGKPTTIKNPQANAILERVHQVIGNMLRTAEIDMSETVTAENISEFVCNVAWAIRSTHHTVLKSTPGAAIFGRDMLFDIPFIADWNKIGEYRQAQTDRNTMLENKGRYDHDYVVGEKILIRKDGILRKSESRYEGPYTITQVHTNGTIRVQRGSCSERLNIRRVTPFFEDGNIEEET